MCNELWLEINEDGTVWLWASEIVDFDLMWAQDRVQMKFVDLEMARRWLPKTSIKKPR